MAKLETKVNSVTGASSKDFTEGSRQGELWCLEAPQGATGQDPNFQGAGEAPISWKQHLSPRSLSSQNLEVLAEMIGTLGLQGRLNWTWGVPYYLFKRPCNTALLHLGFSRTVSVRGVEPIDCVPTRNETAWILPGFSCRDLVSILIKHNGEGAERRLVVCSAYLPYDSENPLPSKELEELVWYCENENL